MFKEYGCSKFISANLSICSQNINQYNYYDINDIYGFGCRAYPVQNSSNEALGTATPPTNLHFDVLRRGYMTVKVQDGTPAKNASVYVRTVAASDPVAQPIGGLECASDGEDCFEITNAKFMGEADSDGNVEISYNL